MLAVALIRSSFVPPVAIHGDLTRTRKQLVPELGLHTQRLQKTLADSSISLTEVVSDILGTSGRAILRALTAGTTALDALAALTTERLKASRPAVLVNALDTAVATLEGRIREVLASFRAPSAS